MKITRSTLKSLIKEEIQQINKGNVKPINEGNYVELKDHDGAVTALTVGNALPAVVEIVALPQSKVAEIAMGARYSLRWPAQRVDAEELTTVEVNLQGEGDEVGGIYTGTRRWLDIFGGSVNSSLIERVLKANLPSDSWAAIKSSQEGQLAMRKGNAMRVGRNSEVGGGWAVVEDDSQGDDVGMAQEPQ